MLRRALLATLLASAITPVLSAKEKILVHRIGPSDSKLFIAKTEGSDERPLLPSSGLDYNASFSADGKWIIFTSERGGSADIYRVHPDGSSLERLTDDPAYDDQAALSPDGKQLAFVSSRGTGSADIWVLDLQSKKARNLTHAPGSFRPCWSPDGRWIAFSSDRNTPVRRLDADRFAQVHAVSIFVMRADGTDVRRLTAAGKFAGSPKWSSDGKRVVFYEMEIHDTYNAMRPGFGIPVDSQIVSVDVATGARQEHTSGPGLKISPQFLSENRIGYVMKAGSRMGLAFTTGDQGASGKMRNASWSRDGKWVVYQKWSYDWPQNRRLFSIDPEFDLADSAPFPAYSHDGMKLAVTNLGTGFVAMPSVSVMDADGTNRKLIFPGEEGVLALAPQWSPKDDWIAFGRGLYFPPRGRPARVMLMRPDGSELHELTKTEGNSGFPSWSPDGKRIVYRFWSGSEYGLRIINLDDGSTTQLTSGFDNFPGWSPKGDLIEFTRFSEGDFDIYTVRPDGTGLKRLTRSPGNDAHAIWSPDGKHLLFSSARFGFKDEAPLYDDIPQPYAELFVMNADGSGQRPLTDNQWEDGTPAWAPASHPDPLILNEADGEHRVGRPAGPRGSFPFTIKVDQHNGKAEDFFVVTETMAPGDAIPLHMHHNAEEIVIFEEGGATVTIRDKRAVAGPHSIVFIPRETWVSIANTSKQTIHSYGLFSRQGFEIYMRALSVAEGDPVTPLNVEELPRLRAAGHASYWDTSKGPSPPASGTTQNPSAPQPLILQEGDGEHRMRRPPRHLPFTIKVDEEFGHAQDFLVLTEIMPPGDIIPFHMHHNAEEVLILEEGGATVTVGDKRSAVGPRSIIFIPRETWVSVTNTSKQAVHLYALFSRQGFDRYLRAASVPEGQAATPLSAEELARLRETGHATYWDTSKGPYPPGVAHP
jgi:Tol biopolymer transport system component/mannose-6-phosphate isomerase-like protein (cupin superfamily)